MAAKLSCMFKRILSEFLGTFILIVCGTGAIVIYKQTGAPSHAGICAVWGALVLALIYSLGEISGAHMNPAVTTAFWVAGRFPAKEIPPYVAAQAAGAIAASALLRYLFPDDILLGATLPSGSELQSFILEVFLMFFLMLVILNVSTGAKEKGITAAIAIGCVVGLEAMFAGPVSGASINPIRSFAPALVSGHLEHIWIYLTAPFAGAFLAVGAHKLLYAEQ